MKKIDRGLFYKVYEYDKNNVIKKRTSNKEKFFILLSWLDFKNLNKKSIKKYNELFENSIIKIKEKLYFIDKNILGNPKFENDFEYIQDKVIILKDYFEKCNLEEKKKLIDEYIKLIFKTWKYGFSDITFNFTIDCGINKNKNLVLVGFSELTFSKKKLIEIINNKKWEKQHSCLRDFKNKKLKQYFKEEMLKNITLENLNKYWNKK